MKMTIDESLNNLIELQKDYQQFHDDVWQDPETYGIIAESLKVAVETMHKYQKIEEIAEKCNLNLLHKEAMSTFMKDVLEVLEDGNEH